MISRPDRSECADVLWENYISKVPEGDLLNFLDLQTGEFEGIVMDLSDEQARRPAAPGKWSIKQVLGHMCDAERILSYRALRFARGDQTELEGFEQDNYVATADSNSRSTTELLEEFKTLRASTLSLLRGFSEEALNRTGVANDARVSVRALAYVVAGHAQHHLELMRAQLGAGAKS